MTTGRYTIGNLGGTRIEIVEFLALHGPHGPTAISQHLGVTRQGLRWHMHELSELGILEPELSRTGHRCERYYAAHRPLHEAGSWLHYLADRVAPL